MKRIIFDTTVDAAEAYKKAIGIAGKSENIQAWTARAKTGVASPQEMQLLESFLRQHGLKMDEYLNCVSIAEGIR